MILLLLIRVSTPFRLCPRPPPASLTKPRVSRPPIMKSICSSVGAVAVAAGPGRAAAARLGALHPITVLASLSLPAAVWGSMHQVIAFVVHRGPTRTTVSLQSISSCGMALTLLSASRDVAWRTPLGLLPNTRARCGAAATRCRHAGAGATVADPPPLFPLTGGHQPFTWFFCVPFVTRPRPEFAWRPLRGADFAPNMWAPATCSLGHPLGASTISPQLRHGHIL